MKIFGLRLKRKCGANKQKKHFCGQCNNFYFGHTSWSSHLKTQQHKDREAIAENFENLKNRENCVITLKREIQGKSPVL